MSLSLRKLAYFPAGFLWLLVVAFLTPAIEGQPVIWPIVAALFIAGGALGGLAWASRLRFSPGEIYVRFFGIRGTTVSLRTIASASYGISLPSLGLGITLRDSEGRKVIVHFGFWDGERLLFTELGRRLRETSPAMDAATEQVVALATDSAAHATVGGGAIDRQPSSATESPGRAEVLAAIVAAIVLLIVVTVGFIYQQGNWPAVVSSFVAGAAATRLGPRPGALESPASAIGQLAILLVPTAILGVLLGPAGGGYLIGYVLALVALWLKNDL